jgi:hypothetical protein
MRPGNLRFRKTPVAASLSIVRVEQAKPDGNKQHHEASEHSDFANNPRDD